MNKFSLNSKITTAVLKSFYKPEFEKKFREPPVCPIICYAHIFSPIQQKRKIFLIVILSENSFVLKRLQKNNVINKILKNYLIQKIQFICEFFFELEKILFLLKTTIFTSDLNKTISSQNQKFQKRV